MPYKKSACAGGLGCNKQPVLAPRAPSLLFADDPAGQTNGAIAQLGERYNGIVEVSGSIPLSSTKLFNGLTQYIISGSNHMGHLLGHLCLDKFPIYQ